MGQLFTTEILSNKKKKNDLNSINNFFSQMFYSIRRHASSNYYVTSEVQNFNTCDI